MFAWVCVRWEFSREGVLAAADMFSAIFEMDLEENAIVYAGVSVVVAALVFLACSSKAQGIRTRLLRSRGVELESTSALKGDDKSKGKNKVLSPNPSSQNHYDSTLCSLEKIFKPRALPYASACRILLVFFPVGR